MNPDDAVRDAILRHLYDVHQKARGPKTVAQGIRDIQKAMRALGHKQQAVTSNLDYLVQKGWVTEVHRERAFTTPQGTSRSQDQITYKISDIGIDKLQRGSVYQRDAGQYINITTIRGVTIVGDGNVVHTESAELDGLLGELEERVKVAPELSDEERLNAAMDVATIRSQLAKPSPNFSAIQAVWAGVEKILTATAFLDLTARIAPLILERAA